MSRDTKRQLDWYQVNDTEAIARHLEKMAGKGWFLEKVGNFTWRFRRGEPRKVHYAIAYFPEASIYDGSLLPEQRTYIEYCEAAGWEFVTSYGPIQYFRNDREDPIPIETDEEAKLKVIRRTMRKTLVPGNLLLIFAQLCNLRNYWVNFKFLPLYTVGNSGRVDIIALLTLFALYLLAILVDYFIWCLRSQHAVNRGRKCAPVHTRARLWSGIALSVFVLGYLAVSWLPEVLRSKWAWLVALCCFVGYEGVYWGSRLVVELMKKRGCSRSATRWAHFCMVVVLAFVCVGTLGRLADHLSETRVLERTPAYITTDRYGNDLYVYQDPLPVTVEDLGYLSEGQDFTYEAESSQSQLAKYWSCQQVPLSGDFDPPNRLSYKVCVIPHDWLRQLCWETLLESVFWRNFTDPAQPMEPLPEGAVEAYRDPTSFQWAVLYPDRIVEVRAGWELTGEQMGKLLETLSVMESKPPVERVV